MTPLQYVAEALCSSIVKIVAAQIQRREGGIVLQRRRQAAAALVIDVVAPQDESAEGRWRGQQQRCNGLCPDIRDGAGTKVEVCERPGREHRREPLRALVSQHKTAPQIQPAPHENQTEKNKSKSSAAVQV
jgi:hypothetical protein